jgi:cytochrome c553
MAAAPSPDGIPAGWRPFAADLLAEATAMAASTNVAEAGGHLGQMALACGTCHTEAGVLEQVTLVALPAEMYDQDVRMDNHQWGSDWMWFGLVTANEDAYRLGATTFTSGRLPAPTQVVSGTDLMPLLGEVAAVAGRAAESQDDEQRAGHYGELLASCAACHSLQMIE